MNITFFLPDKVLRKEENLRLVFENYLMNIVSYKKNTPPKNSFTIKEIFEKYMCYIYIDIMAYFDPSYDGDGTEWDEVLYPQQFEEEFMKILFEKTLPLWADDFTYDSTTELIKCNVQD